MKTISATPLEYSVQKVSTAADAFFDTDAPIWMQAREISDFLYPWERDQPASTLRFRALHNQAYLYCLFRVEEKDVKVYVNTNEKREVVHGERVEIFFAADADLKSYYCLEVDPLGRVFDYAASYYRKFDEAWRWPDQGLRRSWTFGSDGYAIGLQLSFASLRELGLLKDGSLRVGLYRAHCLGVDLQNERMEWATWVKPDSDSPDFHIPSSFGTFRLV